MATSAFAGLTGQYGAILINLPLMFQAIGSLLREVENQAQAK